MSKTNLSRHQFVTAVSGFLGTVMGIVIGLPAIGYIISPARNIKKKEGWIPLGPVEQIPVGIPTLLNFTISQVNGWEKTVTTYGVYVLISEDNQILALSNICTHLSCRVNWKDETQTYACPCHAAGFDINGDVVDGPPPRPLQSFPVEVDENGILSVYFSEEHA